MSDSLTQSDADLAVRIGAELSASPAVVRLEPTLKNALTRLKTRGGRTADAIHVCRSTKSGTTTIDVAVDATVSATTPALSTAADLAYQINKIITANGHRPGRIEVNILSIVPGGTYQRG